MKPSESVIGSGPGIWARAVAMVTCHAYEVPCKGSESESECVTSSVHVSEG